MFGVGDACNAQVDLVEVIDADGVDNRMGRVDLGFGMACRSGCSDCCGRGGRKVVFVGVYHGVDGFGVNACHEMAVLVDRVADEQALRIVPGQGVNIKEGFDLFCQLRQHGFQVQGQQAEAVQCNRAHLVQAVNRFVFLCQFPRLFVGHVLVGAVSQRHDLAQRLGKIA